MLIYGRNPGGEGFCEGKTEERGYFGKGGARALAREGGGGGNAMLLYGRSPVGEAFRAG